MLFVPLLACAQLQEPQQWRSPELLDHPLTGRIWDVAAQRFISVADLADRLTESRILLLGEKHDNPDHHQLQRVILNYLLQANSLSQVTFEMMGSDTQPLLNEIYQQPIASLDELKAYLQWDEQGWNWEFYGPLLELAVQSGKPIYAGNISDATVGTVYAGEIDAATLSVLDEPARARLHEIIDESHCGLLPESQFPAMAAVQQARDAAMATSLLQGSEPGPRVLVAGNFHVRRDLGVPRYLLRQADALPEDAVLSLSFMEVIAGEEQPEAYLERFGDIAPFDLVWFTPSIGEQDYCAQLQ